MKLTDHFSVDEAMASDTALRLGLDNSPSVHQLVALGVSARGMEQVRTALGDRPIHINSWLRCEALERVLCDKDYHAWCSRHSLPVISTSWEEYFSRKAHPLGYAVDFTCASFGTPAEIVAHLRKAGIKFDQLICEGTWVHISFAPPLRGKVLLASFINGVPSYAEA